ncbi:hypothetical protein PFISCL1PPCAC_11110, partial [Pristionchus fissidentatus]
LLFLVSILIAATSCDQFEPIPRENEWPLPVPDSVVPVDSEYGLKSNYTRTTYDSFYPNEIRCPLNTRYLIQHGDGTPYITTFLGNFRYGKGGSARWEDPQERYNFGVKDNVQMSCVATPLLFNNEDCQFTYSDSFAVRIPATIRPRMFKCSSNSKKIVAIRAGERFLGDSMNCTGASLLGNTFSLLNSATGTYQTLTGLGLSVNC